MSILFCRHFISKDNQKLSKLLSRRFKKSVYWNEYKIKNENQDTPSEYRYSLKSIFKGANYKEDEDYKKVKIRKQDFCWVTITLKIIIV